MKSWARNRYGQNLEDISKTFSCRRLSNRIGIVEDPWPRDESVVVLVVHIFPVSLFRLFSFHGLDRVSFFYLWKWLSSCLTVRQLPTGIVASFLACWLADCLNEQSCARTYNIRYSIAGRVDARVGWAIHLRLGPYFRQTQKFPLFGGCLYVRTCVTTLASWRDD